MPPLKKAVVKKKAVPSKSKAKGKEEPKEAPQVVSHEARDVRSLSKVARSVITVRRWAADSEEDETAEDQRWHKIRTKQEISRLTRLAYNEMERIREAKFSKLLQEVKKNNKEIFGKIAESEEGETDWHEYAQKIEDKLYVAAIKEQEQKALARKREEGKRLAPQYLSKEREQEDTE
jgi:hypothetical protein